jgi:hypothetical protein
LAVVEDLAADGVVEIAVVASAALAAEALAVAVPRAAGSV